MTRRDRTRSTMLAATVLAATLLAGCSGDEEPEETPPTTQAGTGSDSGPTTAGADNEATTSPADDGASTTEAPDEAATTTEAPDDATTTQSPDAAAGTVTSADGAFAFTMPEGWTDVTSTVGQPVEAAVRADTMTDDFFTNLVVTAEEPIEDVEGSIEGAAEEIAGDSGDYQMLDPIDVAGEEAFGYVITREDDDLTIAQVQRWVVRDDTMYVLTLSTANSRRDEGRTAFGEVLASWEWQD